jgi:hypothetical protein
MSEAPKHSAFFGDGEKTFALPVELVTELERVTGTGIGGLCRRLFAGDFSYREILETIRLGLIGGGATPQIAAALVHAYGDNRPLTETYPLAVSILETLYFGRANSAGKKKRASK